MEPMQIVLIVLVIAGIWAVVELALVLRRTRSAVDSLDKTMTTVNETIEDVRPVIAKLDDTIETLQPALEQVEPILQRTSIAVEALSADLIEVNGVLRDVSQITGSMSDASGAVSNITNAATEKVQKIFGKKSHENLDETGERTLTEGADETGSGEAVSNEVPEAPTAYFTYGSEGGNGDE